jgi:hypothetical protein
MKTEKTSKFLVWAPIVLSVVAVFASVAALRKVNRTINSRAPHAAAKEDRPKASVPQKGKRPQGKQQESKAEV